MTEKEKTAVQDFIAASMVLIEIIENKKLTSAEVARLDYATKLVLGANEILRSQGL